MFTFPTPYDDAQRLLDTVGSFWSDVYSGNELVANTLHARAQIAAQAHLNLLELVASISRFKLPVFHTDNWTLLTLKESELNAANLPKWDGTYTFGGSIAYDVAVGSDLFAWAAPDGLANARVITNQITNAKYVLTAGTGFTLQDSVLWFTQNPFTSDLVRIREIFEDNVVVDRECDLWIYRGEWDHQQVFTQFGYAIGVHLESSRNYKDLVNAVFDGLVEGSTLRCLHNFISAMTDIPLAHGDETVQYVLTDSRGPWVITDKNAYGFHPDSEITVAVGDDLVAGQTMTNGTVFEEFNTGEVSDAIRAMAVSPGFLAAGYYQELVFENKTVQVVLDTVDGYTKLTFEIGGFPGDVEKFWDDVHVAGVAKGQTLAMLLDTRPVEARDTLPTALALPSTVNPLQFLIANLFRENLLAVTVRPHLFGRNALGLSAARLLRRLVPPHSAVMLFAQLDAGPDEIMMDGPGSDTAAGYEESVSTFLGGSHTESLNGPAYVAETVRAFQMSGQCQ